MKYILIACLVAMAAAGPVCSELANADFASPNTVVPWLTNSFNGGSSSCHQFPEGDLQQCELLQAQSIDGLSNAGRISVGQNSRAICRTPGSQGQNVYQANIGMCRGNTIRVSIGQQDVRRSSRIERFPTKFSIVVGRDANDLLGGVHTEIGSHTFPAPVEGSYTTPQEAEITATWAGPDCGDVCPDTSCWAVGVRIERDDVVRYQIRQYIDELTISDNVDPVVSGNAVTERAAACGGTHAVTVTADASDNCCAAPAVEFCRGADSTLECWPAGDSKDFPVGCTTVTATATDGSGNTASDQFEVCIKNPMPTIQCGSYEENTQTCWSSVTGTGINDESHCGTHDVEYNYAPEGIRSDITTYSFPVGHSIVEACIESDDGLSGTDKACCDIHVDFNLCCERRVLKRSAVPKLIKK